jgi:hypothetical protein
MEAAANTVIGMVNIKINKLLIRTLYFSKFLLSLISKLRELYRG